MPEELQEIADQRSEGRLTVVALDSTWDGALRMKCGYPKNMLQGMTIPVERWGVQTCMSTCCSTSFMYQSISALCLQCASPPVPP
jgi:hypothetical protein